MIYAYKTQDIASCKTLLVTWPCPVIIEASEQDSDVKEMHNNRITYRTTTYEPWHEISNNVAFDKCRLKRACAASFFSLETPNDVRSVA